MLDPVHVLRGEAQTPLRRPDVLPQVDVTLGRGRREQALADDCRAVRVAVQRKRTCAPCGGPTIRFGRMATVTRYDTVRAGMHALRISRRHADACSPTTAGSEHLIAHWLMPPHGDRTAAGMATPARLSPYQASSHCRSASDTACGCSSGDRWPHAGTCTKRACTASAAISSCNAGGVIASSWPHSTSSGPA